jgi:hypothetical protein
MIEGSRFWEWPVAEDRRPLDGGDELVVFVNPDGRGIASAETGWQPMLGVMGLRMRPTADGWQAVAFVPYPGPVERRESPG